MAVFNLYRPLWSSGILTELHVAEVAKLTTRYGIAPARAEARATALIEAMRTQFDDAEVLNWEPYVGTFGLPDVGDEHVLAAAVAGQAGVIVTDNLKHFPTDKIPPGLQVVTPGEFAADTVDISPPTALRAVITVTTRYCRPPMSVDAFLAILRDRYGMDEAVDLINDVR